MNREFTQNEFLKGSFNGFRFVNWIDHSVRQDSQSSVFTYICTSSEINWLLQAEEKEKFTGNENQKSQEPLGP